MGEVKVSIHCLCYNHEKFIVEALDGMVNQKTNFAYEIIVHEDASTDRSAEIVKEYEQKYPELIKVIYQEKNQYSQNIDAFRTHMFPVSRGKYIAICDGDDFWCCEDKLQLQYDFLEAHPDTFMVACNSERIRTDGSKINNVVEVQGSRYIPVEELIFKNKSVPQQSSLMFRREFYEVEQPEWFYKTVMDNRFRLFSACLGKVYYIDRVMAKYRAMVQGSYSMSLRKDQTHYKKQLTSAIEFFEHFDEYTSFKYTEAIKKEITRRSILLAMAERDYKKAHELAKTSGIPLGRKMRTLLFIRYYFPWVEPALKKYAYRKRG